MRVLLLKDVYKLGRAGEVKRVADGYGRNYLIPQGMATLATAGSLKQAERIKSAAEVKRAQLNQEMTAVYSQLNGLQINFPVKAGETGRLYGSVTHQMISDALQGQAGMTVDRGQILGEPIRSLGVHKIRVRLTVDLIPELTVVVHREELPPESAFEIAEVEREAEAAGAFTDLQAELEAQEAEAARKRAEREAARSARRRAPAEREGAEAGRGEEEEEGTGAE